MACSAVLALTTVTASSVSSGAAGASISITGDPLSLYAVENGGPERLGPLEFRGGLALRALDDSFGGLSGLEISDGGDRLTAVSDKGSWFTATLSYDAAGRLDGIAEGAITPMLGLDGDPILGTRKGDAESLRYDGHGGYLVGFEQQHRLWRYPAASSLDDAMPTEISMPPSLRHAPNNGGLEAVASLPDGRIVAVTEEFRRDAGHVFGWVVDDGTFKTFHYPVDEDFRPTDMAALPEGRMLVLERRYVPPLDLSVRLRTFRIESLDESRIPRPRLLAELSWPLNIDNFEGLAVRTDAEGKTLVYLLSDDNFNLMQRTLLMMFVLEDEEAQDRSPEASAGGAQEAAGARGTSTAASAR